MAKLSLGKTRRLGVWLLRVLRFAMRLLIFAVCSACVALAQEEPPPFKVQRQDEDYRVFRNPEARKSPWDSLKFIDLGNEFRLSIGGDIRERYEYFHNAVWGLDPEDNNGFLLQRYMLHADLQWRDRVRFFGQLKSGIETGRVGGPRVPDEDYLDIHQAWTELRLWNPGERREISARVGRQEVSLGSSRLVAIREGPNVRQSFDGAKLTLRWDGWRLDGLAFRPSETQTGIFDNRPDPRQMLWGVYGVGPARFLPSGNIDFYYLGLDRKRRVFDEGAGRELRHSLGTRLWGRPGGWDYDWEAVAQWGSFGDGEIRAWTVATHTGYTWKNLPLQPRFGLKADVASGDSRPGDGRLGTFNALFPRGAYFSQADLLGPYNLIDAHPEIDLKVSRSVGLGLDADFFWRQSTRDGIYDIPGFLIVGGSGTSARYVGAHVNASVEWEINRYMAVESHYLYFTPGRFLREVNLNRHVHYFAIWTQIRF
jgi:hypothetical protein